ncbi:MAG TPA: outer membrane beta-barrel protein [Flavobacterium sp.]|uniref:outer membrane beta-barrel protein n=1 Tax=Flavobacterium sp. TaxID=239 RepID=UPI002CEFFDB5|nr:outer membrane beta-barrel protein [Flavobacterium sp.]HSD15104.1 outer membrane beta-barrel protein [Flavobacterium sp.]
MSNIADYLTYKSNKCMEFLTKKLTLALLLVSSLTFGQRVYNNVSIDVDYGISGVKDPELIDPVHYDFGVRYMFGDTWGIKLDYGFDKFRTQKSPIEMGLNSHRISAQAACNLTNLLDPRSYFYNRDFNVLTHVGLGYTVQKSVTLPRAGNDEIGHIIFGINPQYSITDNLAVGIDFTGLVHFSQHFWFDGKYTYTDPVFNGTPNGTSTLIYNLSLGLSYTFGE